MLTNRLKILPADKSFRKIKTKDYRYYEFPTLNDLKRAIRETEFELESAKQKNDPGIVREVKNYLGELWAMEKNWERKVGVKDKYDVNPDMIEMYKQKFEEAIDNGDKEEMKRWFREIMNHVSFTDAEFQSIGKHNDTPDDQFDAEELAKGIKVEMEHTDDKEMAKSIAKDHLAEIPDYYTRLLKMEAEAKQ